MNILDQDLFPAGLKLHTGMKLFRDQEKMPKGILRMDDITKNNENNIF